CSIPQPRRRFPLRPINYLLTLALAVSVAFGQSAYVSTGGAPLLDQPSGQPLGQVAVTTAVEVLEQSGGHSRIRFDGYVDPRGSADMTVFTNESDAIVMFVASDPAVLAVPAGTEGWISITVEGWVEDGRLVEDLDGLFKTAS